MRLSQGFSAVILLCFSVNVSGDPSPQKLVSLAPHLSELLFDIGAGDQLVGAVEYSDFPEQARQVPRVGDAFRLDRERIASLSPDIILAWEGGTPNAVIDQLNSDGYQVLVLSGSEPEDVATTLIELGELTGQHERAAWLASDFLDELQTLRRRYAEQPSVSVFVQIGSRPLYTVNGQQMIGKVVTLCGGRNIFEDLDDLAPVVSEEAVVAANPQVILATGHTDRGVFDRWKRFSSLDAVASSRLFHLNPDLVTRPTRRLAKGAQEVCERLDEARI
ncbi:MAG: cobalamin-binding protein [Gammaproteobacteria bacterium]